MPRFNSTGGASAKAFKANRARQVRFRGYAAAGNAGVANQPVGIAVGDLVFVAEFTGVARTLTTLTGSAWSYIDVAGSIRVFYKTLNATDVANSWQMSPANSYNISCAFDPNGSGATSVSVDAANSAATSGVTSLTIPGLSMGNAHGAASLFFSNAAAVGTPPPGWVTDMPNLGIGGTTQKMADQLTGAYVGGPIVWTATTVAPCNGFAVKFV